MYINTILIVEESMDKFTGRVMDKITVYQNKGNSVEVQYSTTIYDHRLIFSALLLIKK